VTEGFLSKLILKLEAFIDHAWAVPGLALMAGLDLFVWVIPTEGILISSVLLRPKRWWSMTLWLTSGSAFGALLLAFVTHHLGPLVVESLFDHALSSPSWHQMEFFVGQYGAPALALIAISPFPQQPAVLIAALGGMPLLDIAAMIWLGRFPKYLLFAWLASYAPKVLLKWNWVRRMTANVLPRASDSNPKRV